MTDEKGLLGRSATGRLTLLVIVTLVVIDLVIAAPIDPYQAPYPTALGSGQVPSGAHCTNVSALED